MSNTGTARMALTLFMLGLATVLPAALYQPAIGVEFAMGVTGRDADRQGHSDLLDTTLNDYVQRLEPHEASTMRRGFSDSICFRYAICAERAAGKEMAQVPAPKSSS